MQSMAKQNQAKARVSANQAKHAFAHIKKEDEEKKKKSLDHGLLLMLFFSCKRKNRTEQKSLFMFCNKILLFLLYEKPWAAIDSMTKRQGATEVLCRADTWLRTQCSWDKDSKGRGDRTKKKKKTEWESFVVLQTNHFSHFEKLAAKHFSVTSRVPFLRCWESYLS